VQSWTCDIQVSQASIGTVLSQRAYILFYVKDSVPSADSLLSLPQQISSKPGTVGGATVGAVPSAAAKLMADLKAKKAASLATTAAAKLAVVPTLPSREEKKEVVHHDTNEDSDHDDTHNVNNGGGSSDDDFMFNPSTASLSTQSKKNNSKKEGSSGTMNGKLMITGNSTISSLSPHQSKIRSLSPPPPLTITSSSMPIRRSHSTPIPSSPGIAPLSSPSLPPPPLLSSIPLSNKVTRPIAMTPNQVQRSLMRSASTPSLAIPSPSITSFTSSHTNDSKNIDADLDDEEDNEDNDDDKDEVSYRHPNETRHDGNSTSDEYDSDNDDKENDNQGLHIPNRRRRSEPLNFMSAAHRRVIELIVDTPTSSISIAPLPSASKPTAAPVAQMNSNGHNSAIGNGKKRVRGNDDSNNTNGNDSNIKRQRHIPTSSSSFMGMGMAIKSITPTLTAVPPASYADDDDDTDNGDGEMITNDDDDDDNEIDTSHEPNGISNGRSQYDDSDDDNDDDGAVAIVDDEEEEMMSIPFDPHQMGGSISQYNGVAGTIDPSSL
jgi:hypothetical protein